MSDRPATAPIAGSLESRVEEHHLRLSKHRDRITRLEHQQESTRDALDRGAASFRKLEDRGLTMGKLALIALPGLLAIMVAGYSIVWRASQYPDRAAVHQMIEASSPYLRDRPLVMRVVGGYDGAIEGLRADLGAIKESLAAIRASLEKADRSRRRSDR